MVPWIGLKCVIVVFPDHTHLLFETLILFVVVDILFSHCLLGFCVGLCPS